VPRKASGRERKTGGFVTVGPADWAPLVVKTRLGRSFKELAPKKFGKASGCPLAPFRGSSFLAA
jgi:hypothetical protein